MEKGNPHQIETKSLREGQGYICQPAPLPPECRPSACDSIPPTFPQEILWKTHTFPPLVNKNIPDSSNVKQMVRHPFVYDTPNFLGTGQQVNTNFDSFYSLPKIEKEANLVLKLPMVCYIGLIYNLTTITILRCETDQ